MIWPGLGYGVHGSGEEKERAGRSAIDRSPLSVQVGPDWLDLTQSNQGPAELKKDVVEAKRPRFSFIQKNLSRLDGLNGSAADSDEDLSAVDVTYQLHD
jgi:hypothetical protein